MKTPLWVLLFLSLCVPGRSDCQGDCLNCGLLLSQEQTFNTLMCLLECEAQATPALTWNMCYQAVGLKPAVPSSPALSKQTEHEEKSLPFMNIEGDGVEFSEALERFRHAAQVFSNHQTSDDMQRSDQLGETYDQELDSRMEDEEEQNGVGGEQEQDSNESFNLSKRFGGFIKGRQGFRKLVSSGRPLQKRYGGFIGIRKSARKWNNQKRVSQLLRQYLSLTARTGRSGNFANLSAAAVRQKNEV